MRIARSPIDHVTLVRACTRAQMASSKGRSRVDTSIDWSAASAKRLRACTACAAARSARALPTGISSGRCALRSHRRRSSRSTYCGTSASYPLASRSQSVARGAGAQSALSLGGSALQGRVSTPRGTLRTRTGTLSPHTGYSEYATARPQAAAGSRAHCGRPRCHVCPGTGLRARLGCRCMRGCSRWTRRMHRVRCCHAWAGSGWAASHIHL